MASNPWEILNSNRLNIPAIMEGAQVAKTRRLQEMMLNKQLEREDRKEEREVAAEGRQTKARAAIQRGAKPEEVMGEDLDIGAKYASFVKDNGEASHAAAQRSAQAVVNTVNQLKAFKPGDPRRMQIWQQSVPILKSVGAPDEMLASVDPNNDAFLDTQKASYGAILKAGEDYTLGRTRFSGTTNTPLASVPEDDKWISVPQGGFVQRIPGQGGQPTPQQQGAPLQPSGGVFERMIGAESNGQQFAPDGKPLTSPAGAIGIAQVMPATAPEAAQLAGLAFDPERYRMDPEYNRALGEAYFQKQMSDFGDSALAAAAYNAGPGRVRQALEKGGPQGWINHIPAETQAYVRKVTGSSNNAGGGDQFAGGGSSDRIYGAPKPAYRMLSTQEVSRIPGLDPGKAYQASPDGQISAVSGTGTGQLKPWPATALGAKSSNDAALTNINGAIALLNGKGSESKVARQAVGFGTGALGDQFTQWNNPEGTDARARIGQIGGLIIKDTSGAAVSLSEDQRLAKWVPLVTDSAEVATAKLKNLQRELLQRNQAMSDTYSEDQGFRPFKSAAPKPAPKAAGLTKIKSDADYSRLPSGAVFLAPDGTKRRKP